MGNSLNKLCHPRSDAYSSVQALQPVGRCGWGSATPAGWLYFRCQCGRCSISIHPNRLPTALRNIDSYPAFRRALKSHLFSCAFSLQLFTVIPYIHGHCNGCTDTSDLRHFGPKTFRHWCRSVQWTLRHQRKNLRHFSNGAEVSTRHFGTSAELSWTLRHHYYFI